jgi:PAS domain S-box-containing protein
MNSTHPNLPKDNILIVDDDLSARQTLSVLMEREGYEVRCAPTGQTGLMFAQEEAPDLVLLDIRLPDLDGFQVCQRLKENRKTCDTPVIFISALEEMENRIKGFVVGGVDYITKPFQMEEVLARVDTHLALRRLRRRIEGQNAQLEQEIARSKRAEEKIKKAAEEWEATFNSISDPVSIHDKDFRIVKANKAFVDTVGIKIEEILGKRCYEIIHGTTEPWPNCPHQRALACAKPTTEEFLEPRLGRYLHVSASPIFNDRNELVGSVHIAKDVTERKRAEETLRRSEQRFRNLVETTSDWVWEVDENCVYTYVSPRIHDLLGYQPEEVLGKTPFDLMPPDESERVASIFDPIMTQHAPFRDLENTNQHRDGRLVVLETSGVPFFDTDGRFLGYRGIDRDISERKRAEDALRKAHDGLERRVEERTAELVRANVQLVAANEQLRKESARREQAEETLKERLLFETLLADLSARFVNLPVEQVDSEIQDAQRRICECLDLDRSTLWQRFREESDAYLLTHFHQPPGGPPVPERLKSSISFPWATRKIMAGETLIIARLADLPPEAAHDQETWRHYGTRSTAVVPLSVGGAILGGLSFAMVRAERAWPEPLVKRFQLVAQVFANALARKCADQALRESENRYRAVVETQTELVCRFKPDTTLTFVNSAYARYFGRSAEELIGSPFLSLVPPEAHEGIQRHLLSFSPENKFKGYEHEVFLPDGSRAWQEWTDQAFFDQRGQIVEFQSVGRDITERKRAEEALRKRDESLAEAQRIAHLGSYEWDTVADEITGSEEAYRIFGIPREVPSITFAEFLELVHPDDRDPVNETTRRSLADPGAPLATEYRIIRPDGLERFIYHRGEVTVGDHGKPVRIIGTVHDITDYKRAEEALRASEAQLRLMADSLPVLISYVDREQRYQFNNLAYARWFGVPQDSLQGAPIRNVLGDHAYEAVRGYVEKALAGEDVRFETELRTQGDPGRYVLAHYVPNVDRNGSVLGFYALVQDVTEQKRIDLEIQRQREQLAHVSRVATLGELTASLAHEIHQPLAAIMSNAQAAVRFLAQEDPDLNEVRDILDDIVQDDRRADEVIRRLRRFLRRDKPELTPLDVNELIQEVMTLLKREALLRAVTIDVELDAHLPPVVGDRIQLQQVVLNLILNAADAMVDLAPESRKVIVRTEREDEGQARVALRDFGTGLDEQDLHRIFEPFYTTKPEGLGMGLAICRSIVEAHGGRLRAANNPDRGATFTFTIPVSRGGEA